MNFGSEVADTGTIEELGYPVYASPVSVVPQLLRQRSLNPAGDGGFPSGHTNAFHLAALAFAYAIPPRFQELVTAAFDLSETRIVAGMHSPVDVIGGRILATALAAAAARCWTGPSTGGSWTCGRRPTATARSPATWRSRSTAPAPGAMTSTARAGWSSQAPAR
ncbi:phosphatase PAP2 family protein [Paractinoplanes atraurantiacus]|uniref:phosphatase PAP2 family protein n=1 Tax=Paractinoplanes atraurantiacus TaxID=1036182 RepID=UPI001FE9A9C3|nr:phosphatase PAP2 family protein [Actinoplanes atraurantiacus]